MRRYGTEEPKPGQWTRVAIIGSLLLLVLFAIPSSGCIDTKFFAEALWPAPPEDEPPVFKVLANMSHVFKDYEVSHTTKEIRETFLIGERSEWLELSLRVDISENIPEDVYSAAVDTRHVEITLEHLDTKQFYISRTYNATTTIVFERIQMPDPGYWQVTVTAVGVGYTDLLNNVYQDSFYALCTGMVTK